jgi:tetratricopeptide (TPR) repeat protein
MHATRSLFGFWAVLLAIGSLWTAASSAQGADDSKRFLDALRDNHYHDVALDFLEMMRTSGKVGKEFQETLDYEAGMTFIELSMLGRSSSVREQHLADAKSRLDKFIAEHGSHPLVPSAKRLQADGLSKRAQIRLDQMDQGAKTADDKKRLQEEARALYVEAQKLFESLENAALEPLKEMPKVLPADSPDKARQEQLQKDLLESRMAQATALYQIAHTFPAGTQGYKDNLTAAAKKYSDFYTKYKTFIAGLYARMWEGRCYKDLGDAPKAFSIFEEILVGQPDDPEPFALLKNKTRMLALETALLPSVKKHKAAVAMYKDWQSKVRGQLESSPEGLAIKFLAAEAAMEELRSLKEGDKDRPEYIKTAREAYRYVARFPGEYQARARVKSQDALLGGTEQAGEPKTFAEARDRARDALERMQGAQTNLDLDRSQGKTVDIAKYEADIVAAREEATQYFNLALRMAPADTPIDDINAIRYYMTYLLYASDQLEESAVLGEFLARRYPNSVGGKPGARIAMACYSRMLGTGGPEKKFESDRLVNIAEYIAARWSDQPEADIAWMTLVGAVVRNRDLTTAMEYLKKIPETAAKRGDAEQSIGQLIWSEYLRAARLPDEERPSEEKLDGMRKQAEQVLEDGIGRMQKSGGAVTATLASSVLYLAQIYVETGQAEKAVKLIDDPKIGVKTLVDANDPSTQRPNFAEETLRVALRAYVATQELDKAEAAMATLEKIVRQRDDAEASKRLTQIYIRLGKELQDQLERLRAEHKNAEVAKVTEGFSLFLNKILERDKGNNFNSLNWVAVTFTGLADGLDAGGTLSNEAKGYYEKANASYDKILARLAEPDFGAPENIGNAIRIRQAKVLRRLGDYKQAMALLLGVLKERQTVIDAQIEAAYTLQAWASERPELYEIVITGSRKQKEVWGWGQLARKVQTVEGFEKVFHEARYNLALCRFKHAQVEKDEKKTALLDQATKDVEVIFRLFPEMGGPEWMEKYDQLLKSIQKLKGSSPTGIKGLEQAAEADKKAQTQKTAAK